jgi:hypothetical protein
LYHWFCCSLTIYTFLIRPKDSLLYDEGVVIINPIEEITIGWADVIGRWTPNGLLLSKPRILRSALGLPQRQDATMRDTSMPTEIKGMGVELDGTMRTADSPKLR